MEKDIRIVALDLDGTLLDSQNRLSEANRAALAKAAVPIWLPSRACSRPFQILARLRATS